MLQAIYEAVDGGEASARIFFADFSKGFDLIDQSILMQELADLEVHPVLLSWITAFLTYRKQAVRIRSTLSDWLTLKGGVPQGTKLGVILFTVMTNRLLSDWRLRIKYVDDTSALEIIPRNSPSFLNVVASDIHNFAIAQNMRLNPTKCKEMHINFLRNSNCLINPIIIGGNVIKSVNTYKILGVIMDNDLKWNSHVDYIIKKACKSQGVPTQHVEDIPLLSSASFGVCSTGLAGYSCLSVRSHTAHALLLGKLDRLDDRRVHKSIIFSGTFRPAGQRE